MVFIDLLQSPFQPLKFRLPFPLQPANGQGEIKEECLRNLTEAIQLLLENEREEAFRLDPEAETAELLLA